MRRRPARPRLLAATAVAVTALGAAAASGNTPVTPVPGDPITVTAESDPGPVPVKGDVADPAYTPSVALGTPNHGHLRNGVVLPEIGPDHVTWDPILSAWPNREWRRYGTDTLIRTFLRVAAGYREANPGAPKLVVGDLSRTHGGDFGRRFGGIGHASHQNGLDIDVYYPRTDGKLRPPRHVFQIDDRLANALLQRFLAIGPQYIFVGPSTGLRGPRRIVQPLIHHDDHMHVRIFNPWPLAAD